MNPHEASEIAPALRVLLILYIFYKKFDFIFFSISFITFYKQCQKD